MKSEDDSEVYLDDQEESSNPDYYECLCCGYSCAKRPAFGGQCPKCTAYMEEGYF